MSLVNLTPSSVPIIDQSSWSAANCQNESKIDPNCPGLSAEPSSTAFAVTETPPGDVIVNAQGVSTLLAKSIVTTSAIAAIGATL